MEQSNNNPLSDSRTSAKYLGEPKIKGLALIIP